MTIFYLVRHAHANWLPDENRPLSERGLSDAQRVADILHQFPINAIYSSPYRRAYQTVVPYAKRLNLSITILADLRERQLAGKPVENFAKAVETVWQNPSFAHPGGSKHNCPTTRRGGCQAVETATSNKRPVCSINSDRLTIHLLGRVSHPP